LVTSPKGAALQDVWTTLKKRFPRIQILLCPVLVQGEYAVQSICEALSLLQTQGNCDLIILTRGGGSLEDLQAFNDEKVARAIAASKLPLISAIGHESDLTIADCVADRRALTPTEAGFLAVPDEKELRDALEERRKKLQDSVQQQIAIKRLRLHAFTQHYGFHTPKQQVQQYRRDLLERSHQLHQVLRQNQYRFQQKLSLMASQIENLSPIGTLKRGFALVHTLDQQRIYGLEDVEIGDPLQIQFAQGVLTVEVKEKNSIPLESPLKKNPAKSSQS
jgi:exodeoxyribonuclease VII large subunit